MPNCGENYPYDGGCYVPVPLSREQEQAFKEYNDWVMLLCEPCQYVAKCNKSVFGLTPKQRCQWLDDKIESFEGANP